MRILALMILGLLVVGCDSASPPKPTDQNSNKTTPRNLTAEEEKQKALRDSVLGKYEWEFKGSRLYEDIGIDIPEDMRIDTIKLVFLENSIVEDYENGVKNTEHKWEISNGEIHIDKGEFPTGVYRINQDKSITYILSIWDGKRTDTPKERQITFIKIKQQYTHKKRH